nr:MAG TPA: hypothetical protein [Caudoviricetes sp.]
MISLAFVISLSLVIICIIYTLFRYCQWMIQKKIFFF